MYEIVMYNQSFGVGVAKRDGKRYIVKKKDILHPDPDKFLKRGEWVDATYGFLPTGEMVLRNISSPKFAFETKEALYVSC